MTNQILFHSNLVLPKSLLHSTAILTLRKVLKLKKKTVKRYLTQSIQPDLTENCKTDLTIEGDTYYATITGDIDHVEDYYNEITSL